MVPETEEDETTSIREPCPFCGVLYTVKAGKVAHDVPVCTAFGPNFLERARKEAAKRKPETAGTMKKILLLVLGLAACAGAAQATYEGELARCVDQARTREESHACRADVNAKWHVDAGGFDGNAE